MNRAEYTIIETGIIVGESKFNGIEPDVIVFSAEPPEWHHH